MRSLLATIIISVALLTALPVGASPSADNSTTRLAREGIDSLMRLEFDKATRVFKRLGSTYPDYPLLGVLEASVYWVKAEASQGEETKPAWNEASVQLANAIKIATKGVKKYPNNYLWKLNLGMANFYAGRVEIERQNLFKAIRYARTGRDILRDLIKERPNTEDAYFVLGVYEYLAGSVPRSLRWITYILDIRGERDLGIQYLKRATAGAEVMAPEAARMLLVAAAIEPEYNQPCQYLPLARDTRRNYPQNPHYSIALQLILANCGYPGEALAENKRAFRVYIERFSGMTDALNLVKLQVYPAMGALDEIEKLAPVFENKNYHFWYLAKAQTYDVIGQRKKARYMYREIESAGDNPDESTTFSEPPPDLVYDKAMLYLKQPYRRIEPVKVNKKTALSLNIPGKKSTRSAGSKLSDR
ncbi:MAG: hypothetical protein ACC641_07055 [Acidiferrobacterales bacterium]